MRNDGRAAALAAAMAVGAARPAPAPLPPDDALTREAGVHWSPSVQTQFVVASRLREAMLKLARAGELDSAQRIGRLLAEAVGSLPRPSLAATMADTLDAAAIGFVHFTAGRWDAALTQMDSALVAAAALPPTIAAAQVHPRCVHLMANRVRVQVAMGAVTDAVHTGCALVRHLDGDDGAWPCAVVGPVSLIAAVEPAVRDSQRAQLVDQLRGAFGGSAAGDRVALASVLDGHAGCSRGPTPTWWRWWRAWCANDVEARWAAGVALLAEGRAVAPRLYSEVQRELEEMVA
jgi:hypothetical protein